MQFQPFFSAILEAHLTDSVTERGRSGTVMSSALAESGCLRVLAGGKYRVSEPYLVSQVLDLAPGRCPDALRSRSDIRISNCHGQ